MALQRLVHSELGPYVPAAEKLPVERSVSEYTLDNAYWFTDPNDSYGFVLISLKILSASLSAA